jgi:hypothetical protein
MFWRKVIVDYYRDDDTEFVIKIEEESEGIFLIDEHRYDLKKYPTQIDLYNKTLDDFDKEFDDEISNALDKITKQIFKEVE